MPTAVGATLGMLLLWDGAAWRGMHAAEELEGTQTGSGAQTIDFSGRRHRRITLTGATTFTFTAPAGAQWLTLVIVQDGTGNRTVTWPSSSVVKWPAGAASGVTQTANAVDIFNLYYDGAVFHIHREVADSR